MEVSTDKQKVSGYSLDELRNRMKEIDSSELIWASTESDEIFDTPRLLRHE